MAKLGYDDNGNFVGINNIMVRKALGANTSNVESLCQHQNINKWAHDKPFNRVIRSEHTLNGLEFARLMTEEDRIDSRYGLTFPQVVTESYNGNNPDGTTYSGIFPKVAMEGCTTEEDARAEFEYKYQTFGEGNYVIDPDGQFYGKPYGGDKSYITYEDGKEVLHKHESICRLSDFDGYDHYSRNPFTGTFEKVVEKDALGFVIGVYYKLRVELRRSTEDYGGLTIDNWRQQSGELYRGYYLCVGIYDYEGIFIYGMLDAIPYDAGSGSDVVDNASIKLDSDFHPIKDGISTYEFILTNDTLNKVAERAKLATGLYAVLPFITKHPERVYENGNHDNLYPLFSPSYTDHNFLLFENGVWHVRRLFYNRLRLFYNANYSTSTNSDPNHPGTDFEQDENTENTSFSIIAGDWIKGENVTYMSATANRLGTISSNSNGAGAVFSDAHTGLVIEAGENLVDIVPSKKRCITVGDYWSNDNMYFTAGSRSSLPVEGASSGLRGVPLCNIKLRRESDGFVTDGIVFSTSDAIYMSFIPADQDAENLIGVRLSTTDMDGTVQTEIVYIPQMKNICLFRSMDTGMFKSITFVNEVDEELRLKTFLRCFTAGYSWDNITELDDSQNDGMLAIWVPSETKSSDMLPTGDGSFSVPVNDETYIPYLEPAVIEGHKLLSFANMEREVSADIPIGFDEDGEIIYKTVTQTYVYNEFVAPTDVSALCGIQISMEDEADLRNKEDSYKPATLW